MNEDLRAQRILATIVQFAIVPMCFIGSWARIGDMTKYRPRDMEKITFLQTVMRQGGNKIPVIIIAACGILAVLLVWTKLYYWAVVPTAVQLIMVLRTYGYCSALRRNTEGFADLFGMIHIGVVALGIILAGLMTKGYVDWKKSKEVEKVLKEDKK